MYVLYALGFGYVMYVLGFMHVLYPLSIKLVLYVFVRYECALCTLQYTPCFCEPCLMYVAVCTRPEGLCFVFCGLRIGLNVCDLCTGLYVRAFRTGLSSLWNPSARAQPPVGRGSQGSVHQRRWQAALAARGCSSTAMLDARMGSQLSTESHPLHVPAGGGLAFPPISCT